MQEFHPHAVREQVFSLLATLNPKPDRFQSETILFHENKYCGHRFALGEFRAVWLLKENRVIIFNGTGRPLRNLTVEQLFQAQQQPAERKAA